MHSKQFVALLFFLLCSCYYGPVEKPGPKGTAHGKVTYTSTNLPEGFRVQLMHRGGTGFAISCSIQPDGTFTLNNKKIPAGVYGVAVSPEPGPQLSHEELLERAKNPAKYEPAVKIPDKYMAADTSDITIEIKENTDTEVIVEIPGK